MLFHALDFEDNGGLPLAETLDSAICHMDNTKYETITNDLICDQNSPFDHWNRVKRDLTTANQHVY